MWMEREKVPVFLKTRWRVRARMRAIGRLRPRERSARRESMKDIVVGGVDGFERGEGRLVKKVRRRWKAC
jgi:hypothetical protein